MALLAEPVGGQLLAFGKNKIHYRSFDWQILRGEHIDLYFYPDEEELARVALAYAEESYRFLQAKFQHAPRRRIPLIIYASHADFEQTNILPFVPPENILGVTEFLKRRVSLPFNGDYTEFRHTLRHELVHAFQLSVVEQEFERYPGGRRAPLPLWWSEGLAEFWAGGDDPRDEMVLRDLTINGPLPTLAQLTPTTSAIVYPVGHVIHTWLAEHFGEWRIAAMYQDRWKYGTFAEAMAGVYGKSLTQLSDEWQHWMRRRYYPLVSERDPLSARGRRLTRLAIKPAVYVRDSSRVELFYLSPRTGYTNIYAQRLFGDGSARAVVKGERTAEFESFHGFRSRLDVSSNGVVVFTSKYLERDALFFWDLATDRVVGRYQFPELVSLLSPSWAPDGRSVVFSGLSLSGYSDLYRLDLESGRLMRLTSDRYQDVDPSVSPDGRSVVFASDRTPFGIDGALNLFILDLATLTIRYLTYGPWRDEGARWSPANGRIYFSSDRAGAFGIYSSTPSGDARRELLTLNGAFDPVWVAERGELIFGAFADFSWSVYAARPDTIPQELELITTLVAERLPHSEWTWSELDDPRYARADAEPYARKFSLDFAAGDALIVPGIGSVQGATFLLSDLLSDHLVFIGLTSFQGEGLGGLLDNVNGNLFYLNQAQRLNWGLGAFRTRGVFFEGDFETIFEESAYGIYGVLRYPLSRFRRIDARYQIERSDRLDVVGDDVAERRRVGWLAANFLSFVKDNTLWLRTGPIDGERYNLSVGGVSDLTNGRFDSFVGSIDYRRYFRVALLSSYAVRGFAYYAGGSRPRRINIGGPWALRGYPRFGRVAGTRVLLVSQELRFPLTNFLSVGFPFGAVRFPGVQGAIFADAGRAWTAATESTRGVLGSAGFGLRMPVFPPIVLRLDFGWRFSILGDDSGYSLRGGRRFVDFFFGFNY